MRSTIWDERFGSKVCDIFLDPNYFGHFDLKVPKFENVVVKWIRVQQTSNPKIERLDQKIVRLDPKSIKVYKYNSVQKFCTDFWKTQILSWSNQYPISHQLNIIHVNTTAQPNLHLWFQCYKLWIQCFTLKIQRFQPLRLIVMHQSLDPK